jgi:hypothetical protein
VSAVDKATFLQPNQISPHTGRRLAENSGKFFDRRLTLP